MKPPEWDLDSAKGRRAMVQWLDAKLEEWFAEKADQTDWPSDEEVALNYPELFLSDEEKSLKAAREGDLTLLRDRLAKSEASPEEQKIAAEHLPSYKRGRGRPRKSRDQRARENEHEWMAEVIVPRIKQLWKDHYNKRYDYHNDAIELCVELFWDADESGFHEIVQRIHGHLNKSKTRRAKYQP